jgi:hypothetical protein
LRASETPRFPKESTDWYAIPQSFEETRRSGIFWTARRRTLLGSVRALESEPVLDFRKVRLRLLPVDKRPDSDRPSAEVGATAQASEWLEASTHRLWPKDVGPVADDGTFSVEVPRIRDLAIVADADGWVPCSETISVHSEAPTVALVLHVGILLSGTLLSGDGSPISGASIVVYTTRHGTYEDFGPKSARLLQPSGGVAGSRNKLTNKSHVTLTSSTTSKSGGQFQVRLSGEGEVRIVVYAADHALGDSILGHMDSSRSGIEIRVDRLEGPRFAVLRSGDTLLTRFKVMVSDLSGVAQPAYSYETDEAGRLDTGWLVAGRQYLIVPMSDGPGFPRRAPHFVTWKGDPELDFQTLPTKKP